MDLKEYREQYYINRHDADFMGNLKPGSFLRFAQQVATNHCAKLNFTPAFYQQHNCVHLLARQAMEFYRVPRIDETLTLITRPERTKRAVSRRVTYALDEQGQEVAMLDSWWVLVDTNTRRILRRGLEPMENFWNEDVDRSLEIRVPKAEQLRALPSRLADYLLCDLNGHINNCSYADLACANVPLELVRQQPIRKLSIIYHREVPMGDTLHLQTGEAEQGWYTCGTRASDGMPAFEAFCQM